MVSENLQVSALCLCMFSPCLCRPSIGFYRSSTGFCRLFHIPAGLLQVFCKPSPGICFSAGLFLVSASILQVSAGFVKDLELSLQACSMSHQACSMSHQACSRSCTHLGYDFRESERGLQSHNKEVCRDLEACEELEQVFKDWEQACRYLQRLSVLE